jgi:hypothetical protein
VDPNRWAIENKTTQDSIKFSVSGFVNATSRKEETIGGTQALSTNKRKTLFKTQPTMHTKGKEFYKYNLGHGLEDRLS